jgi:hypothetical protein
MWQCNNLLLTAFLHLQTPSTPGNIWLIEVMINENGTLYDVETVNIHVT